MLIYRTRTVYENILKWGVLCSLEEDCISHGSRNCYFWGKASWAHCSRYDQTILNILCSNYYGFDNLKYTCGDKLHNVHEIFPVHRFSQGHKSPVFCKDGYSQTSTSCMLKLLYLMPGLCYFCRKIRCHDLMPGLCYFCRKIPNARPVSNMAIYI